MTKVEQLEVEIELLKEVIALMDKDHTDDVFSYGYLEGMLQGKQERLEMAKSHFKRSIKLFN